MPSPVPVSHKQELMNDYVIAPVASNQSHGRTENKAIVLAEPKEPLIPHKLLYLPLPSCMLPGVAAAQR